MTAGNGRTIGCIFRTPRDIQETIFTEVYIQSFRNGVNTPTLVTTLKDMMRLDGLPECILETCIRISIEELLQERQLLMTASGVLALPEEPPEPKIQQFNHDWFVIEGETIIGPLKQWEAVKYGVGSHV